MKEPYAGDTKLVQLNGKFLMHKEFSGMSDAFLQLIILENDEVVQALGGRDVLRVVIIGNLVNIITR